VNPFLCVADLAGRPVGMAPLAAALPALTRADGELQYVLHDAWAAAWVPSDAFGRPAIARRGHLVAVGTARISNRREVARDLGVAPSGDLDLALELFARRGGPAIRALLGAFAFVIWDPQQQAVFAARDALGRQPLFVRQEGHRLLLASHLDCLPRGRFDEAFLAGFLAGRPPAGRTVDAGIRRVEPGQWLVGSRGRVLTGRFWSPDEFVPAEGPGDPGEAVPAFRSLLREAVAAEVDGEVAPWSHLSGGLDSSSVVSVASGLAGEGRLPASLGGTVTVVDSLADGDETRWSEAVRRRWGLRNERVVDFGAWQDDGAPPPRLAEPTHFLPFWARDREMCRRVRAGGGRVLLSGYGADNYLAGSFDFLADRFAAGHWRETVAALVDLAVTTRQSFWDAARRHVLDPLRGRGAAAPVAAAAWMTPAAIEAVRVAADGPAPGRFARQVAREVAGVEVFLERGPFEDGIEMRYPFLHRPLVEFGLRLPAALRVRPHAQKWILRQALGGLLPPEVCARTGKGGIDGRLVWSLNAERRLLRRLIAESHLADLGLVDRDALARAFESARQGLVPNVVGVFFTLSLETWLASQSGWWNRNAPSLSAGCKTGPVQPPRKELHHVEVR
jgi:asparagine synthase (glutamine-hydrolysing)